MLKNDFLVLIFYISEFSKTVEVMEIDPLPQGK